MCGIVGYIGNKDAKKNLIEGLKRLEYRGYDSAGISLLDQSNCSLLKSLGRVKDLEAKSFDLNDASMGIAHTRWATHGKVTEINAHPHQSSDGRFVIVHNGVIDNYKEIELDYLSNMSKVSETDTESIANLLSLNIQKYEKIEALSKTFEVLEGSFALVILDRENPYEMIIAKNKSPLIIGKSVERIVIASDVLALAGLVDKIHVMHDRTFAVIDIEHIDLFNRYKEKIEPNFQPFNVNPVIATRGEFPHYMLKEIFEQPEIIERLVTHAKHESYNRRLKNLFKEASSIEIIAAGTSYHAGLYSKHLLVNKLNKPCNVHVASEFAYHPPFISEKPLFIFVSQSGETADLISCLKRVKKHQFNSISLTNVPTSTLATDVDYTIDLMAGPEIAVASTKAFTGQVTTFALIIDFLNGTNQYQNALIKIAGEMRRLLGEHDKIKTYIEHFLVKHNAFFIGRGIDYTIALEASLKLKEISYIQSEAFPAGELKHGTIALIEENTPVITLLTEEKTSKLTRSNIEELSARGASSLVISQENLAKDTDQITIKKIHPKLDALTTIIPNQLIAYYAALHRGHDIDKPRNLAKSVTVE